MYILPRFQSVDPTLKVTIKRACEALLSINQQHQVVIYTEQGFCLVQACDTMYLKATSNYKEGYLLALFVAILIETVPLSLKAEVALS